MSVKEQMKSDLLCVYDEIGSVAYCEGKEFKVIFAENFALQESKTKTITIMSDNMSLLQLGSVITIDDVDYEVDNFESTGDYGLENIVGVFKK